MTLGEVISAYRKEHSLSMDGFAKASGLSKAYISILERNITPRGAEPVPSIDTYRAVASAIHMDLDELIRKVDGKIKLSSLPSNVTPLPPMEKVPLVGQIACGTPILAEENITDYIDLPAHIHADYALTCKGDSMIGAGIHDGDIVYIRKQEMVENGQIAAIRMNDDCDATLKRFYRIGDTVTLNAENPAIPPMVFIKDEINDLRIVGLAVAYTHVIE